MQLNFSGKIRQILPSKTFLVMKLTVFLLTIACVQLSARSYSQDIHFTGRNVALEQALLAIEKQSGYYFFYKYNELQQAHPVTVNLQQVSVEKALEEIFKDQPLTYAFDHKIIVVRKKPMGEKEAIQERQTIKGHVKDQEGRPLPGASVRLKGTSVVTQTDTQGSFTLRNLTDEVVLVVTYTGFVTREMAVAANQSEISITLVANLQDLKEVVVVGYGTQKRDHIASAISTFKPDELNSRPVLGPDQMIQGKMAGVMVSTGSGNPGSGNRVSIRGIGSLSASNEPLYVIDGIPVQARNAALFNFGESMNPLAELNPSDIESIDVLKDAASAAIYGSRATNGVVLITTKSGKKGKSRLNVDAYTGIQQVPYLDKLKMADSKLYVEVINEAIDHYNLQYGYEPGAGNFVPYIANPYPGLPDTDWLDLVLQTAKTNSANISFSGGSDKGTYYISGSYLNQDGAIKTNNLKKYTGKINLTQNVFSWLQVGANTNFSFSHNNRIPGSNLGSTVLARGLEQRPFDRPYKPDGSYYVGGTSELLRNNAVQILNEQQSYLNNHRFLGNFYATVHLSENLAFKSSLGTDIVYTHDYVYYNENHPYGTGSGRLIDNTRLLSNLVAENTLTYTKQWDLLDMELLGGHSFQKLNLSNNMVDGNGFPSPSFDVNSVAATISDASTGLSEYALESYFARANFTYANRYLLALSMRADGSSRFAPKKRTGYFPSVSAGWTISKEDFWKMANTDLKLRASYGETGNQEGIGNYDYQALAGGGYNYNNLSGLAITNVGNSDLTWESARQFDGGIDLGIQNDKFRLTADYFVKNTMNLLYEKPTAATTGFTSITTNIGSMRNWGYELGLQANLNFGQLAWSSDFNISFIKNKLTSLIGDDALLIGANRVLKVGEEVGSFYIYKQLGIFQQDEEVPQTLYDTGIRAGDVHYEDIDNNGAIDVNDRQVVGSSNPDFFGGWNNSFQYKNFDLNFAITYSYGAEVYAPWRINVSRLGGTYFPFLESEANGRWTGPGTSNTVPRAISGNTYNTYNSTRFLEDGSFLRMRYVSLGYNLPAKLLTKLKLERLRVYVQADNLFLLTGYSGIDPEVSDNLDPKFIGDDNLVMPQLRSFNLGVNLTF